MGGGKLSIAAIKRKYMIPCIIALLSVSFLVGVLLFLRKKMSTEKVRIGFP